MFIHDPPKPSTRKELKVNLTARQHRDLRALQARTGHETPRVITDALQAYFQKLAQQQAARGRI